MQGKIGYRSFLVILSLVILLSSGITYAYSLTFQTTLGAGSMVSESSFIVFKDGLTYYAKNGKTGALFYSSSNASAVFSFLVPLITNYERVVSTKGEIALTNSLVLTNHEKLVINGRIYSTVPDLIMIRNIDQTVHGNHDIEISGGIIDGTFVVNSAIKFESVNNFKISGITFKPIKQVGASLGSFIQLTANCSWGVISQNIFDAQNTGLGINVADFSHDITITTNTFNQPYDSAVDCTQVGTSITTVHDITISGNTIDKTGTGQGYGLAVHNNAKRITLVGNTIIGAYYEGISTIWAGEGHNRPREITISGNTISNSGRSGINAWDTVGATISCNVITNTVLYGIAIWNNQTVTGNIITIASRGIEIGDNVRDAIITSNRISQTEYPVHEGSGADYNMIIANNFNNNTNGIYTVGSNDKINLNWDNGSWID